MQLGFNPAAPVYYTTALEFSNLTMPGTWWNGLPAGSPATPVTGNLPASGDTQPDDYGYMRPGTYTLACNGSGTLRFGCLDLPGGGVNCTFPGGPYNFNLTGKWGITITILNNAGYAGGKLMDVKLVLRDLAVYGPGSVPSQTFQPTYLSAFKGAACIRGMDWQSTNNVAGVRGVWAPNVSMPLINLPGLVELANATNTNLWINAPARAFGTSGLTDWCASAGAYVAENLNPDLTCNVEWGNEPWNGAFEFLAYLQSMVTPLGVGNAGWPGVYAIGANACFNAFMAQIPPTGPKVQRVVCGQAGNYAGSLAGTLYYMKQRGWGFDVIGCAPYAVWPNKGACTNAAVAALVASGGDAVGLICEGFASQIAGFDTPMLPWAQAATAYGKPLVYYECGLDAMDTGLWAAAPAAMQAAYQDSRYGALIEQTYLPKIASYGANTANWYDLCRPQWGAWQNIDTPTVVSNAVQAWIAANG